MSATSIPMPAGAVPAAGAPGGGGAIPEQSSPSGPAGGSVPMPPGAVSGPQASTDPAITGEILNDVGNKVIVPKDGEEFSDTMARAVSHWKSLSPEQQQEAYQRETQPKDLTEKGAETMGAAALLGFGGGAALASPLELHAAMSAGIKALLPALTAGTVYVGQWAQAHPVAAKAILETLKMAVAGTIAGKVAGGAKKVINAAGE
jgi:hypothetical protein